MCRKIDLYFSSLGPRTVASYLTSCFGCKKIKFIYIILYRQNDTFPGLSLDCVLPAVWCDVCGWTSTIFSLARHESQQFLVINSESIRSKRLDSTIGSREALIKREDVSAIKVVSPLMQLQRSSLGVRVLGGKLRTPMAFYSVFQKIPAANVGAHKL
jgi:hypothetical protein